MDEAAARAAVILLWKEMLTKATEFDLWGQPVEATDTYNRLIRQIHHETDICSHFFTDEQKKTLKKIALCLDIRCKILQTPSQVGSINLEDLTNIKSGFVELLSPDNNQLFPVSVTHLTPGSWQVDPIGGRSDVCSLPRDVSDEEEREMEEEAEIYGGSLLPPVVPVAGKTYLTIRIEKLSIKDASQYIDCFLTVSVKDLAGVDMSINQDTPIALQKRESAVIFGEDVYIQDPLESFPPGFAVFFEFKHYKPKKKSTSIKCWAFMEHDEIKDGSAAVELYKKPTDTRRKKLNLMTVKPMYLHLKLMLN